MSTPRRPYRAELLRVLESLALPSGAPGAHECAGDPEEAHKRADAALLAFINDPEITVAFGAIEKWYA